MIISDYFDTDSNIIFKKLMEIDLYKHGIFQLLLWRLRDMNNFEFWRQFSAFVELILGVKVAPNRADANFGKIARTLSFCWF